MRVLVRGCVGEDADIIVVAVGSDSLQALLRRTHVLPRPRGELLVLFFKGNQIPWKSEGSRALYDPASSAERTGVE